MGLHVFVVDDDSEALHLIQTVLEYAGALVTRTLGAGFDAHLHKPVDPWELCRVIAALARRA